MWNRIDPLIQPIARKVEHANSRMEIRRDESENMGGRKRGAQEDGQSAIPWEDVTVVSVAGLRNFLQSLLGDKGQTSSESMEKEKNPELPKEANLENHEPINTYVSRATHAYQMTGKAVHDKNMEEPRAAISSSMDAAITLGGDFGEEERSLISGYIDSLGDLEKRGVIEITLRRTLTFLDAIRQGIIDARPAA